MLREGPSEQVGFVSRGTRAGFDTGSWQAVSCDRQLRQIFISTADDIEFGEVLAVVAQGSPGSEALSGKWMAHPTRRVS